MTVRCCCASLCVHDGCDSDSGRYISFLHMSCEVHVGCSRTCSTQRALDLCPVELAVTDASDMDVLKIHVHGPDVTTQLPLTHDAPKSPGPSQVGCHLGGPCKTRKTRDGRATRTGQGCGGQIWRCSLIHTPYSLLVRGGSEFSYHLLAVQ